MDQNPSSGFFENRESWRQWLLDHHDRFREFWVIYYKKHTGKQSLVYREALEEALCFGWIDGRIKRIDDETYMQRFTPRRKRSNWSETNKRLALLLLSEGRMHESGLAFRELWETQAEGNLPEPDRPIDTDSILNEIRQFPDAFAFFQALPLSCKKEYLLWIGSCRRPDTRNKRVAEAITLLEKGKRLGMK